MQGTRCPNHNHSRTNVTVRFCPMCGEVVNADILQRKCREEEHAGLRRARDKYCVHCGKQLIQGK